MPIYIFYHICLHGPWKDVVKDQVSKLEKSGLLDKASLFMCGVLGAEKDLATLKAMLPEKAIIAFHSDQLNLFEFPTLMLLQEQAAVNDGYFLYLHTKGVTRYSNNTRDWRLFMDYYAIERYEDSVQALNNGFDCAGVNWRTYPWKHYSGNFWWAKSDYLRKLQPLNYSADRFSCESFIGTANPNAFCHLNSGIDHYYVPFPREKYVKD